MGLFKLFKPKSGNRENDLFLGRQITRKNFPESIDYLSRHSGWGKDLSRILREASKDVANAPWEDFLTVTPSGKYLNDLRPGEEEQAYGNLKIDKAYAENLDLEKYPVFVFILTVENRFTYAGFHELLVAFNETLKEIQLQNREMGGSGSFDPEVTLDYNLWNELTTMIVLGFEPGIGTDQSGQKQ